MRSRTSSLLSNSVGLAAARLLPMGLGFCSWLLAARVFPAVEVGLASAAVAAALLGVQLALLGLGTATVSLLPSAASPRAFLDAVLTALTVAGLAVALLMLGLAHVTGADSGQAVATPQHAVLFVILVVASTLAFYVDHVFVALLEAHKAVLRGLVNAVVVLGGVTAGALLSAGSGLTVILSAWVGGAVASLVVGLLQVKRSRLGYRPGVRRVDGPVLGGLLRAGAGHHLVNVTERAPGLVLPVLVTELLTPESTAAWYAVWMIATAVYLVPASVGLAVQAQAADPAAGEKALRQALRFSTLLGVATALAFVPVAGLLLGLLGSTYAAATSTLWLLLPAVAPVAVVQVYLALCRATSSLREGAALNAVAGAGVLLLAAGGAAVHGLIGVAAAWLVVQLASAAWCWARLPRLRAMLRPVDPEPEPESYEGRSAGIDSACR